MPRLTVGIPFKPTENWVGGIHYVRNLVRALALIEERNRPSIVVIADETDALAHLPADYPEIIRVPRSGFRQSWTRLFSWTRSGTVDVVLPGTLPGLEPRAIPWVPDLQEEKFPQFFADREIAARRRTNSRWFAEHRHVMVSSQDVKQDIKRYYPAFDNDIHVVNFTSFLDHEPQPPEIAALRAKYQLPDRYFICSNQLWQHKNHALVLRALSELRDRPLPPVVFTGRESDYRNEGFAPSIKALAANLGVEQRVRFLGFLPRTDQMGLLAGAITLIQPSLCEGWSTAIEDAKALGKYVLASNIAVHREQIRQNAEFFAVDEHRELAALLARCGAADPATARIDYRADQRRFSDSLLKLIATADADFRGRRVTPIPYWA